LRERWVRRRERGGEEGRDLQPRERGVREIGRDGGEVDRGGEGWIRVEGLRL